MVIVGTPLWTALMVDCGLCVREWDRRAGLMWSPVEAPVEAECGGRCGGGLWKPFVEALCGSPLCGSRLWKPFVEVPNVEDFSGSYNCGTTPLKTLENNPWGG